MSHKPSDITVLTMPFARFSALLAAAALSLYTLTPCLLAETVDVQFFSPKRTGDSYWMEDTRTFQTKQVSTLNGELNNHREDSISSVFEANVTVIKNNAAGRAIEERFEVLKFIVSQNGGEAETLLPSGTVIFGYLDLGEKVFAYPDGKKVPKKVSDYLSTIIALRDNSITDQDTFSPGKPVSVGDSWPINAALMSEDLNFDQSLITDKKYIDGTVTLVGIKDVDGKDYAHLKNACEITRIELPKSTGMKVLVGTLNYTVDAWLPLKGKVYPLEQTVETKLKLIFEPAKQNQFERRQIMSTTTIKATVKAKELPRDESVTQLDRTLGIRR